MSIGIGNRIGASSSSWKSYWASLVSATVEQTDPSKVILTFSKANTTLLETDFSVLHHTITLLERDATNKIFTLTLSEAIISFEDYLTVSLNKGSGLAHSITNNVTDDGNTFGWYRPLIAGGARRNVSNQEDIWWEQILGSSGRGAEENSGSTVRFQIYELVKNTTSNYFFTGLGTPGDIFVCAAVKTLDTNHIVKKVIGNHLANYTLANCPVNGVFYDTQYLKMPPTTLNQPMMVYIVFKQITRTSLDYIFDGNTTASVCLQQTSVDYQMAASAGTVSAPITDFPLNTLGIIRVLFNGANSLIQLNNEVPIRWNCGVNNAGGFTLAAKGAGGGQCSNVEVVELIIRNTAVADSVDIIEKIYKHCAYAHNLDPEPYIFDNGKLLITFDDTTVSEYTNGFPLLETQGVKGTFYITSDYTGLNLKLSWAQIQEMLGAGHSIQDHGKDHTSFTSLDEVGIGVQLDAVDSAFSSNNIPLAKHISYPSGLTSANVISWIGGRRITGRTSGAGGDIYRTTSKMELPAFGIDNIGDAGVISLKAVLDNVKLRKSAKIIYTHGVEDADDIYAISKTHFNDIIDYAQSVGLDIILIPKLEELMI